MRVVIAEDSALVRAGLAAMLGDCGVTVLAQAADAGGLLAAVREFRPDVAIIDIRMPPTHTDEGLRAAARIRRADRTIGLLLLSEFIDIGFALRLLDDGEPHTGYLLKERVTDVRTLRNALNQVRSGGVILDPELSGRLFRGVRSGSVDTLSTTESRVLELIAQGRTDRAIAAIMLLSPKTIEAHINRIFRKLELPASPQDNRRVHAVLKYLHGADQGRRLSQSVDATA